MLWVCFFLLSSLGQVELFPKKRKNLFQRPIQTTQEIEEHRTNMTKLIYKLDRRRAFVRNLSSFILCLANFVIAVSLYAITIQLEQLNTRNYCIFVGLVSIVGLIGSFMCSILCIKFYTCNYAEQILPEQRNGTWYQNKGLIEPNTIFCCIFLAISILWVVGCFILY